MLEQILPPRIDNTYSGRKLALWLFALVVAVRAFQSLFIIFNGYSVAQRADGIPLDTFSPAAAQTVVSLFALYSFRRFDLPPPPVNCSRAARLTLYSPRPFPISSARLRPAACGARGGVGQGGEECRSG
jgi:hypothetical protein